MKNLLAFVTLLFSTFSQASELSEVHVLRSTNGEVNQKVVLPFDSTKSIILKEVWRSPAGIACKATTIQQKIGLPKGSFECQSKEGYKAQIALDCAVNKSKDTSAYLFFGLVGKFKNIGNFFVWCE